MENQENEMSTGKVLYAKDIISPFVQQNKSVSELSAQEQQDIINKIFEEYQRQGGQPVVWKKPYYLLVMPIISLVAIILFNIQFSLQWFYTFITIGFAVGFVYYRFEEFVTQKIEITPFSLIYTYKSGLFHVNTVSLLFGSKDFAEFNVVPYEGWFSWTKWLHIRRWFKSSDVNIRATNGSVVVLRSVFECEKFEEYLVKRVDDFLSCVIPDYKSKTVVTINGKEYIE